MTHEEATKTLCLLPTKMSIISILRPLAAQRRPGAPLSLSRCSARCTSCCAWYDEAAKPKVDGGRPRVRKAHGIISMFRRLFSYGISAELPECARLIAILAPAR